MNDQLDHPQSVEVLDPPVIAPKPKVPTRHASPPPTPEPPKQQRPTAPKRSAFDDNDDDSEDDSFIGRHGGKLTIVALLVVGGITAWFIAQPKAEIVRKAPERIVTIQAVPPPPPPPPPPPKIQPPPPQEQKMLEQAPVEKEPDPEPEPADDLPIISTNNKGDGPGMKGLGGGSKEGRIGGTGLGSGRAGGPFDGFARKTQNRVQGAIAAHRKTRAARISGCDLRVWVDTTGRITRVKVSPSTGDAATDAALQGDVLVGVQLEPPPPGMPMPIVMRVSARRPN